MREGQKRKRKEIVKKIKISFNKKNPKLLNKKVIATATGTEFFCIFKSIYNYLNLFQKNHEI